MDRNFNIGTGNWTGTGGKEADGRRGIEENGRRIEEEKSKDGKLDLSYYFFPLEND